MAHPQEFTDTDPRAMEVWLSLLQTMTSGERLGAEAEVRPRELMIQVFAWDPALHGITPPSQNALADLPVGGQRVDIAYVRKWASPEPVSKPTVASAFHFARPAKIVFPHGNRQSLRAPAVRAALGPVVGRVANFSG